MAKILSNQLLFGTIVALIIYWTLGTILPSPYISTTASFLMLMGGGFASFRYMPPAVQIVILNRRVEDVPNERDYYPVYGSALLGLGAVYTGLFGMLWALSGYPPEWTATVYSSFGRALMAGGFLLLFLGPSESKEGIKLPNLAWLIVIILIAISASFLAGIRVASTPDDRETWKFLKMHGESRPACDASKPVWISSSGTIHPQLSKYRSLVIPKQCFATEKEAIEAGFRPLGWKHASEPFNVGIPKQ